MLNGVECEGGAVEAAIKKIHEMTPNGSPKPQLGIGWGDGKFFVDVYTVTGKDGCVRKTLFLANDKSLPVAVLKATDGYKSNFPLKVTDAVFVVEATGAVSPNFVMAIDGDYAIVALGATGGCRRAKVSELFRTLEAAQEFVKKTGQWGCSVTWGTIVDGAVGPMTCVAVLDQLKK